MRRTYRSKKETGGALDHKDVIQGLDEKSSAFDAFYIQNIKQTKRELSCFGASSHYVGAANKVRKRKYVKRIIKDPEPRVSSSPSQSVFLTPDKSMRVNRGDLFDQLLNSSTAQPVDSPRNIRIKTGKQESKVYTRKLAKVKKYNYSSSDSNDSDKENSNEDSELQNVTDLQSYNLVIEREKKPSPKYLDESINKIVRNMSSLGSINFQRDTSIGTAKDTFNIAKHRLTCNVVQSPSNSPLSSTPFKEKYRSQSIYKFSPISFGKNDVSTDSVTIVEENGNDSVVFVDKNAESLQESNSENVVPSPILHLSKHKNVKSNSPILKTNSPIFDQDIVTSHPDLSTKTDELHSKTLEVSTIEISDFQTTEAEPFFGFSDSKKHRSQIVCCDDANTSVNNCDNNSVNHNKTGSIHNYDVVDDKPEDSNIILETISYDEKNDTENSLLQEPENGNDSSYDTCNSEQSLEHDNLDAIKIPVVKIEKLNNSVLKKYLNKYSVCESIDSTIEDKTDKLDSDDYASFDSSQSPNCSDDSDNVTSIESEYEMPSDENNSNDSSETEDTEADDKELNSNSEEERCISFVTTRRRNEVINDSLILSFNNSYGSRSSTDCDKTVLSNNNEKTKIQASLSPNLSQACEENVTTEILSATAKDDDDELKELKNPSDTTRMSAISTRKNSILQPRPSDISNRSIMDEGKPGIVLQPGKKWERSLSIYRRMTMMTDSFDQSILDDDEFNNKGRKYRQSVISTMELQDKSSLHNESIISRRSTFVSKPCRSTIRIIKEPNSSRLSLCTTAVSEDLVGFLNEDCDDTIVELSKLSIADSAHEVTVIENFHDTSNRVSTARDYVLRRCGQSETIPFDECYPEAVLKNCRKIGEGVYGEVFLWRARDGRARVMKIVPIAGTTKVNGEHQKDFHEIISEIVIAMELSALRAPINEIQREIDEGKSIDSLDLHSVENATDVFNEVLAVRCVYGAYPSRLLDLWELYDECNGSENDTPAVLPPDQQYIVLELANAGQDLESYEFNSAEQAHALFLQVAFGLAVAEEAFQFEHRDLHWGNVLIAPTDQKFATFVLRGRSHRVARCGVAGTVIDYSLSRLALPLPGAGEQAALYNDLAADEGLFDAVGDYQFQVYRLMKEKLGNDWKNFEPYTNILWLHYTVDKMITALRYKRTNTKIHKHYIAKLKGIKNRILEYGSAAQFVLTDNEF